MSKPWRGYSALPFWTGKKLSFRFLVHSAVWKCLGSFPSRLKEGSWTAAPPSIAKMRRCLMLAQFESKIQDNGVQRRCVLCPIPVHPAIYGGSSPSDFGQTPVDAGYCVGDGVLFVFFCLRLRGGVCIQTFSAFLSCCSAQILTATSWPARTSLLARFFSPSKTDVLFFLAFRLVQRAACAAFSLISACTTD